MGIFSIFEILATPLGYVMRFMYGLVQNYGIALILFTVLIRLLMFPLTIMQQKSTAKNAAYQPMIQELQKKWANDKQRQQQELMKFQEENGIKMTAGCLPMILNMLVLFSVIAVIYQPLTHILGIDAALITQAADYVGTLPDLGTVSNYTAQSYIIDLVNQNDPTLAGILGADAVNMIQSFNFNFLGLNMAEVPTFSWATIATVILPALSILTMFLSQIIVMKTSGQQQAGAGKSMLVMTVVMGVWFGFYAFTVPVGFSLYYTVSNILSLVQQLIVKRIYDPEKFKQQILEEFEERKKAKKAKKVVKVTDETGNVVSKEMTDDELARLRLAKARELDAKRYAEEQAEAAEAEQALEKARARDEEKYKQKTEKKQAKIVEKSADIPETGEAIAPADETLTAAPAEEEGAEEPAAEEAGQPDQPKQEYKPGRRKRARQKKEQAPGEGPSFADRERATEESKPTEE